MATRRSSGTWRVSRARHVEGYFALSSWCAFSKSTPVSGSDPDLEQWHAWIWAQPYEPHPDYAVFKGQWYSRIDPRFVEFFPRGVTSRIRLDEVEPGGVTVNGIPPLE